MRVAFHNLDGRMAVRCEQKQPRAVDAAYLAVSSRLFKSDEPPRSRKAAAHIIPLLAGADAGQQKGD